MSPPGSGELPDGRFRRVREAEYLAGVLGQQPPRLRQLHATPQPVEHWYTEALLQLSLISRVSAGWLTCSRSAAAVTLPVSATALNAARWVKFIVYQIYMVIISNMYFKYIAAAHKVHSSTDLYTENRREHTGCNIKRTAARLS